MAGGFLTADDHSGVLIGQRLAGELGGGGPGGAGLTTLTWEDRNAIMFNMAHTGLTF